MNGNEEKYLPVGTVVLLKNGSKRTMITGFCSMEGENTNKVWDYSGCFYPEGILTSNQTFLFDHEQIAKIFHMGLKDDDEEREFKRKIKELLNSMPLSNANAMNSIANNAVEKPVYDE